MTTITIHNYATVNAEGIHINGNAKSVYNATKDKVYTSSRDASKDLGVSPSTISWAVTGRTKRCKGCLLCLVRDIPERLDDIMAEHRIQAEKAKAYDELIAKQEATRRANENLEKCKERVAKYKEQYEQALDDLIKAEKEVQEIGEWRN
jgi:hypothetical protein